MPHNIPTIRVSKRRITIALLLICILLVSGCIGGKCDPDNASKTKNVEASSVLGCMDACRELGIGWKSQAYGQSTDKTVIYCECYTCFI
jgi:hypothetical protein